MGCGRSPQMDVYVCMYVCVCVCVWARRHACRVSVCGPCVSLWIYCACVYKNVQVTCSHSSVQPICTHGRWECATCRLRPTSVCVQVWATVFFCVLSTHVLNLRDQTAARALSSRNIGMFDNDTVNEMRKSQRNLSGLPQNSQRDLQRSTASQPSVRHAGHTHRHHTHTVAHAHIHTQHKHTASHTYTQSHIHTVTHKSHARSTHAVAQRCSARLLHVRERKGVEGKHGVSAT